MDNADDVVLTAQGHVLLRSRMAELGDRMRSVGRLLAAGLPDDGEVARCYARVSTEHAMLCSVLLKARPMDTVPGDPASVVIGDHVLIGLDDGTVESFMVVHPLEASLDGSRDAALTPARVSVESPLGRALLGRRVLETVEVATAASSYHCRILHADRY